MVTQRIKAAIGKIGEANPALASHLRKNIRTGLFCRYEPEAHVVWQVLNRVITR